MEWISVEDRLPDEKDKKNGIIIQCEGKKHIAYWNDIDVPHDSQKEAGYWQVGGIDDDCRYCAGQNRFDFATEKCAVNPIVYEWMPLPELQEIEKPKLT